jgi:tetratricopeptide (TPR) repeat protein
LNKEELSNKNNDFCVRFHTILKDYDAKNLPQSSDFLIIEDIGLICRHPDNKKIGITIALSQRTKPENKINNFKSIANDFISNAKFIPFTKSNTELGLDAFREHAYDKAIKNFNKAIAENPKDYSAYFYKGFCYFDQKKYTLALTDWKEVISLKEDYIEAYANIASIYLEMKDYEQALFYVNDAIKYASSLSEEDQHRREVPTAYKMRMVINYELKKYDEVIQDGRYLVKLDDQDWYVYNNLVSDIANHSPDVNRTECIALLKKAEDLASKNEFAYIYDTYGELFLRLEENKNALDYFNKAFSQSNDPKLKKKIKGKISKVRL